MSQHKQQVQRQTETKPGWNVGSDADDGPVVAGLQKVDWTHMNAGTGYSLQ